MTNAREGAGSPPPRLTDDERRTVAQASEVGSLSADGNCAYSGFSDPSHAAGYVLGRAKHLLKEQAAIIARLTGEDGDA